MKSNNIVADRYALWTTHIQSCVAHTNFFDEKVDISEGYDLKPESESAQPAIRLEFADYSSKRLALELLSRVLWTRKGYAFSNLVVAEYPQHDGAEEM